MKVTPHVRERKGVGKKIFENQLIGVVTNQGKFVFMRLANPRAREGSERETLRR